MMAEEISNRTLAYLLVAAIIISLGGTLVSLNRLGIIGPTQVTGAATTGNVSVQIDQDSSINVTATSIDFGQGSITGGSSYAILDSDADNNQFWSGSDIQEYLTIENAGNIDLNISFTSTHDASTFIGGTNPEFNYTSINDESSSCASGLVSEGTVSTGGADLDVCGNLSSAAASDTINVSIRLYIPDDTGYKEGNATFTFSSTTA